jgi:hypothetical protein
LRLSFNEIRTRAAQFAENYADARYEKGETQTFYNDFFAIFGVERRSVARYEEHVKKLNDRSGFIDLFWPKVLLVEQKSAGRDLAKAGAQAGEYFDALKESERPRFQLLCDFQTFQLLDRDTREETAFALVDLPKHIEKFSFIMGMEKRSFKDQDPVNIKAAELVGHLHDALEAGGYKGHQLEVFLTRLVFCLFADDTGIFEPRDIFLEFLETRTSSDGSDTGPLLTQLFEVLDTPENKRQTNLDEDLARFPYVNGGLFLDPIRTPAFNSEMRERLIEAARFNWSGISPAIFGSLFQSVMNKVERRKAGAHYTTEKNIMKVIGPLFLDDLRTEFETIRVRKTGRKYLLQTFHDKLSKLTFMDPACGCGNFLIITYRELRLLEIDLLRELTPKKQLSLDAQILSRIDVDQFYGIEYAEFPARIAETAMWMMDHIMNAQLSLEFGQVFLRIPLRKSPSITNGDALELDWEMLLSPKKCSYIIGNPPFIGQSYQSKEQREQMRRLTNPNGKTASPLDYVGAWFLKAGAYVQGHNIAFAFVSTNSITQGEQVGLLWPALLDQYKLDIAFAHQTFAWGSEARGKAAVHVIAIGLVSQAHTRKVKRLFTYPDIKGDPTESQCQAISPYLIDASKLADPHLIIKDTRKALTPRPPVLYGSKPTDNGGLIFSASERAEGISAEPTLAAYLRPLIGAHDFLSGINRYCLWLPEAHPKTLKASKIIQNRMDIVRKFRIASSKKTTREDARRSWEFSEIRHVEGPFIAIPAHTSERRDYVPFAFFSSNEITHNSCFAVRNAAISDFAILTSSMHMAWMRTIGGKLKSDYRYSVGLVYNTFPMPPVKDLKKLEPFAQAILDARAKFPDATLADLYDPDTMPTDLLKAHTANDKAVDKLYRKSGFKSERERVEHLFGLYEKMTSGMLATTKKPRKRKVAV